MITTLYAVKKLFKGETVFKDFTVGFPLWDSIFDIQRNLTINRGDANQIVIEEHDNHAELIQFQLVNTDFSVEKPPLGLRPRHIANQLRKREILDAMIRYCDANKPIPLDWVKELEDLG